MDTNNNLYLKRVLTRFKELHRDHPDYRKFALEQARLRINDSNTPSYLVDLHEPYW